MKCFELAATTTAQSQKSQGAYTLISLRRIHEQRISGARGAEVPLPDDPEPRIAPNGLD
jgi:hypothetical protein